MRRVQCGLGIRVYTHLSVVPATVKYTVVSVRCLSTALSEVKQYAERKKMDIHYVSRDTLERMSSKRPHQVHVIYMLSHLQPL